MTDWPLPTRLKKVYRVRSEHSMNYGGKTYIRTRHFFSKTNAQRSYNSLMKQMGGLAHTPWGKPLKVQFSESAPLFFEDDDAQWRSAG